MQCGWGRLHLKVGGIFPDIVGNTALGDGSYLGNSWSCSDMG